jgi:hypothetical protein
VREEKKQRLKVPKQHWGIKENSQPSKVLKQSWGHKEKSKGSKNSEHKK